MNEPTSPLPPVSASNQQTINPYREIRLEIGSKLGPHLIKQLIGEGGVANVYKVWHTGLEVTRAIKILKRGFNKEARERFLTEAKILADIRHPNVIEIHSLGYAEQQVPFIEMEFVDGTPVSKLLVQHRRLPLAVALSIAYFVCQALHFAHTKNYTLYGKVYHGLIHRDIKPDNIVLSSDGIVKLMDFGIARPSEISLHTVGDKIMGTLVYLSPEQLLGKTLDHRTDIFSLGAVLFEMITGERAFPQKKLSDLVQAKSKAQYRPIESFGIPLPAAISELIARSLALDVDRRYASAGEFGQAIYTVLREVSPLSPQSILIHYAGNPSSIPHWRPPRLKTFRLIHLAAAAVGALFIVLIVAAVFLILK